MTRAELDMHLSLLMQRAQEGESAAYRELLSRAAEITRNYLSSRYPQSEDREDLTQECLMALHAARHSFDPSRSFLGWFFALLRNKIKDDIRCRNAQVRDTHEVSFTEEIADSPREDPFSALEQLVNREDLHNYLAQVSANLRELVLLRIFGYSSREVGVKLGLKESNVRVKFSRAVSRMLNTKNG